MDFARPSPAWTPAILTIVLAATAALAGCSNSSSELRTPGQAAGFVAEVASGEPSGDWHLASGASQQATQAWAARATIGDLGRRLRGEEASWTCEMARKLVALGSVGGTAFFDTNDVNIVTDEALRVGARPDRISAMTHDARIVPFRDLALATAVVCGPPAT